MTNQKPYEPRVRGLIRTRRTLLAAIKLQTGVQFGHDAKTFFDVLDKWIATRGLRDSVLRLKACNHVIVNHLFKQPLPNYPGLGLDNEGWPKHFKKLKKYRSTSAGKQAILGLLGYHRLIVAPGIPNFDPITDQSKAIPGTTNKILETSVPNNWYFCPKDLPPPEHLYRSKAGPNGSATHSAAIDLVALVDAGSNIISDIDYICRTQVDGKEVEELPQEVINFYKENPEFPMPSFGEPNEVWDSLENLRPFVSSAAAKHSKLSVKREGGGKDRVFAIVDHWTQCTLAPLHHHLASILRTIPSDCTFDQGKGVQTLKQWTLGSKNLYSVDLSNATDRFPRDLQAGLLKKLTRSDEYGERWADLMANRTFTYRKRQVRWTVGQPLGALSSWPMFALTHHYLVRHCAHKLGIEPEYFLLGDDIVIRGYPLYEEYMKQLGLLGVEVSLTKSMTGKSCEFAKRLFTKGVEVSPAAVRMIDSLLVDPSLIKATVDHLVSRASSKEDSSFRIISFVEEYSLIKGIPQQRLLDIAMSPVPVREARTDIHGICSDLVRGESYWSQVDNLSLQQAQVIYSATTYNMLKRQIKNLQKKTDQEWSLLEKMEFPGLPQDTALREYHPLAKALDHRSGQLLSALGRLSKFESERKFIPGSAVEIVVPQLEILSIEVRTSSRKAVKLEKLIISETINNIKLIRSLIDNRTLSSSDTATMFTIITETDTTSI